MKHPRRLFALLPHHSRAVAWLLAAILLLLTHAPSHAARISLNPPADQEAVRDLARLLAPEDIEQINALAAKLRADKGVPIIVVTIESMEKYGGAGLHIDTFTRMLLDQWQSGSMALSRQNWNNGIIMVVSQKDRRVHIEPGRTWKREKDELAMRITEEQVIPRFRNGKFAGGIVKGAAAMDMIARDMKLPMTYRPWAHYGIAVLVAGLLVGTIVSLARRGAAGWAWAAWGAIFGALAYVMHHALTSQGRSRSGGGGGISGGTADGQFSGGVEAKSSW